MREVLILYVGILIFMNIGIKLFWIVGLIVVGKLVVIVIILLSGLRVCLFNFGEVSVVSVSKFVEELDVVVKIWGILINFLSFFLKVLLKWLVVSYLLRDVLIINCNFLVLIIFLEGGIMFVFVIKGFGFNVLFVYWVISWEICLCRLFVVIILIF